MTQQCAAPCVCVRCRRQRLYQLARTAAKRVSKPPNPPSAPSHPTRLKCRNLWVFSVGNRRCDPHFESSTPVLTNVPTGVQVEGKYVTWRKICHVEEGKRKGSSIWQRSERKHRGGYVAAAQATGASGGPSFDDTPCAEV